MVRREIKGKREDKITRVVKYTEERRKEMKKK